MEQQITKGMTVETPKGIGTVVGMYPGPAGMVYYVALPRGKDVFLGHKLTPVTGSNADARPRTCGAFLEGKLDRHCRNRATVQTENGWVCCKHAKGGR